MSAESITGLYSTGVGPSGLLAPGSVDPNWSITATTDPKGPGSAYVVDHPATSNPPPPIPCCWVGNTSTSQWINPSGVGNQSFGNYDYSYSTTFTLPSGPTPYTSISGLFAADDTVSILLNGTTELGPGNGHYYLWTPFDITSGFTSGTNTLTFVVSNATGVATGLQVDLSSTYTPEPASIALVGIALLGAGIIFRRRLTA